MTTGEGKWALHVDLRGKQESEGNQSGGNIVIKPFSIMSSSDNYTMSIGNESVSFDGKDIGMQQLYFSRMIRDMLFMFFLRVAWK